MFSARPDQIDKIVSRPNKIYNFCILAHVDHGKTTLCDHLLATNAIISKDLAGDVRYMDCLPAERARNITMKTSAVSLLYKHENDLLYLTVVDSPGHVDFEAEVSNAVRLSDGCIILVDAIEGVCVQTELVLRVAFREGLKPILVINKVDRLFIERSLDPNGAELHLQQLLTDVNAATGQEENVFDPSLGNVIFASCIEKWGISVPQISATWATRLEKTHEQCAELFWGSKYFDPTTRTIVMTPPKPDSRSFFAQAVMYPFWQAHQASVKVADMAKSLGIQAGPKDTPISLLGKKYPLSNALLENVVKFMETPATAQERGIAPICPAIDSYPEISQGVKTVSLDGPMLAFAPKIVHGGLLRFPHQHTYQFIAYLRVYCGSIRVGDTLYTRHERVAGVSTIKVEALYMFMGNELLQIERAPAGCVVGLALSEPILKQTTLSSLEDFPLFTSVTHFAQPILKVSIEAIDLARQADLQHGSELLAKIDPAVTVTNEANGQLVLACMGQVHLDYCIDELKNFLAKDIEFSVSEPIVPIRETIIATGTRIKSGIGTTELTASCYPLPPEAIDIIRSKDTWPLAELNTAMAPFTDSAEIIDYDNCNLLIANQQFATYFSSLTAGFRLTVGNGPLAEEPIFGVAFVVDEVSIRQLTLAYLLENDDEEGFVPEARGSSFLSGETISCAKEAYRNAFLAASPRVMEPMFRCEIQADFSVIGKTFDVLQQHRCHILEEREKEGTTSSYISCWLPVLESFTFASDLRSKASGKAHPQLAFSHFELVPEDPFWKPQTDEEMELYGQNWQEQKPNIAKRIVEIVKKRKGIWVENIEQKADKQSTISRAK